MDKQVNSVKILYTSDVHGHAVPLLYGTNETADLGLVKYATIVKEAREVNDELIVLDNGDLIQGTPLMTHYMKKYQEEPNPMIKLMNEIELDAAVIGNHEFNYGKQVLSDAVDESHFPWLSANILDDKTNEPYFGPPYITKELSNGVKVALVGVTTHYIPNWESPGHTEGIHFADSFLTLQKWVQTIHEFEKPDVLIASYHGGFERDLDTGEPTEVLTGENQGYQICQQIEGIDVLLTGHQHRELTGKINDVLVIQPGKHGENYGKIDIQLQSDGDKWKIIDKQAELQTLEGIKSDPKAMELVEEMEASTQQWLDQPIGTIEGNMMINDPFEARLYKHSFIEFIQKVQMDASGVDISATTLFRNDEEIGFSNNVTMREVVSNYMYPNTLVVLELTKQDIIAALEKSAEYFTLDDDGNIIVNPAFIYPKPQHYNYDMWEGIEYILNIAQPIGHRVEQVTYNHQPLDDNELYYVVLNNYRATGGGHFDMFKGKRVVKEIQIETAELIRAYFEKHPTVQAELTRNYIVKAL